MLEKTKAARARRAETRRLGRTIKEARQALASHRSEMERRYGGEAGGQGGGFGRDGMDNPARRKKSATARALAAAKK